MIDSWKHNFLDLAFLLEYIQFLLLDLFPSCVKDQMFLFLRSALINLLIVFCVLHWLCSKLGDFREKQTEIVSISKYKTACVSLNANNYCKKCEERIIKLLFQLKFVFNIYINKIILIRLNSFIRDLKYNYKASKFAAIDNLSVIYWIYLIIIKFVLKIDYILSPSFSEFSSTICLFQSFAIIFFKDCFFLDIFCLMFCCFIVSLADYTTC